MADALERWILKVMSGEARGVAASIARATMAAAEPAYARVAAARNRRFDDGRKEVVRLARPVVSIGNLTTGGTGKTPAVQWLVRALQAQGERPGVLLRGYRKPAEVGSTSDEEQLLRASLGVPVVADADRVRGAATMLARDADVSVIVLDDGFQHRRVAREVDVVLIDATNPFGFDHVLPRGLLREPVAGLARAHLAILTRVDQATHPMIAAITERARLYNTHVPIVRTSHRLISGIECDAVRPIADYVGRSAFAVSAIGNPAAFERSLTDAGIYLVGTRRFSDHHAFTETEIDAVITLAINAGADSIFTTEKDWTKLERLKSVTTSKLAFVRAAMRLEFAAIDEAIALATIHSRIRPMSASAGA